MARRVGRSPAVGLGSGGTPPALVFGLLISAVSLLEGAVALRPGVRPPSTGGRAGRTLRATACDAWACVDAPDEAPMAIARWEDAGNETGWGVLSVNVSSAAGPGEGAFAAGFLEGNATYKHIASTAYNTYAFAKTSFGGPDFPSQNVRKFLDEQYSYAKELATREGGYPRCDSGDPNAVELCIVLRQTEGITAAYAARNPSANNATLDILILNSLGDLLQIVDAVEPSRRVDWLNMENDEALRLARTRTHCSGLIRVTDGFERLYFAHSSWFFYGNMNRIFKHYDLPSASGRTQMSFSSYPGLLESLDDFYMLWHSGMAMVQTSNNVFDHTLLELVTPRSLLAWQRVRIASAVARSGSGWCTAMTYGPASGTYANQYMVVDLSKFKAGEACEDGLLTVCEDAPGLLPQADVTDQLRRGYWPSYNYPYFPSVREASGYGAMVKKLGSNFTYDLVSRAKIFRREAPKVHDLKGMEHIMRYNEYQTDPYSGGDPMASICSRGDLSPTHPSGDGCYDSKVSSDTLYASRSAYALNGPTSQDEPSFSWSAAAASVRSMSHVGEPDAFAFGWRRQTFGAAPLVS